MKTHAFRLESGTDLKKSIEEYVARHDIRAGYIVSCVGSLSHAVIRLAGAKDYLNLPEHFEIVSLVGTLSAEGSHIHVSVADAEGLVRGGHLMEGSIVRTTAEVILGQDETHNFGRSFDKTTGFKELTVQPV